MKNSAFIYTSDRLIRISLKKSLQETYKSDPHAKIIEELGIQHGAARVDIAVVNGILHGYELKSDLDNLNRLPEQMRIYNTVLDNMTLIVGKNHLYDAFKIVPPWWGIQIAKITDSEGTICFSNIRNADENPNRDSLSIAKLLWKAEALDILDTLGEIKGMRSKPREQVYQKLISVLDQPTLRKTVRETLFNRPNWRVASPHKQCDGLFQL